MVFEKFLKNNLEIVYLYFKNQSNFVIKIYNFKKMRSFFISIFVGTLLCLLSCRSDFSFSPSTGNLEFSKDTVYLDTVFSKISSSTYSLKVYNRSSKDIKIPVLQLEKGLLSKYRMTVDGDQGENGKIFRNTELLANDSLYIFVETTAKIDDANPTDFLYTDTILFDSGSNLQKVALVTLIQDAFFIYPNRENGIYDQVAIGLDDQNVVQTVRGRALIGNHPDNGNEFVFTNQKPYVIYGYASVPEGKTLTINAGARIHFHADSGLIVQQNASLKINGEKSMTKYLEKEVIFEGDRLEPFYSDVPGQWGFVYLRQGSKNHKIDHLTLKNAIVGLIVENNVGAVMQLDNSQFYDCSNVGIYGRFAHIEATNVVVNNAGQAALACTLGGNYNFRHCTFNNSWPSSKQLSVLIDNFYTDANKQDVAFDLTQATFSNCLIYGNNQTEMILNKNDSKLFNYQFNNCLIKFNSDDNLFKNNILYDFTSSNYVNCLVSNNTTTIKPNFQNVNKNKLNIDETSEAVKKGDATFLVPFDILGNPRNTLFAPDLGAYQNAAFPK